LNLIAKLIDYETNPDCEGSIFILRMLRVEHIKLMKLEEHIKSTNSFVVNNACKILKILTNGDKAVNILSILKDERLINNFNNFLMSY